MPTRQDANFFWAIALVVVIAIAVAVYSSLGSKADSSLPLDDASLLARLTELSQTSVQKARGLVVHVTTTDASAARQASQDARTIWGLDPEVTVTGGLGSGTVIRKDGHIVTNLHVVEGIRDLQVVLPDGASRPARIVASDSQTDLALLRVDAELADVVWGDSDTLGAGTPVWALGSPFRGLEQSITAGIVSSYEHRALGPGTYRDLIQTDVTIHPGFSGGPLVNVRGELVGIHVAMIGSQQHGMSLAIPGNVVRRVVDEMLGKRSSPSSITMGLRLSDGSAAGSPPGRGVLVTGFDPDSEPNPARAAGIRIGDRILDWQGKRIDDVQALRRHVDGTPPGNSVAIGVLRDLGQRITLVFER